MIGTAITPAAVLPVVLLPISATLSGCVTTLGYVPEYVEASEDTDTLQPATMNRQALYSGAVLAAASICAIVGLAAFGSNSSALIEIPIGTGFLGALAAVYQSDEKAAIYGSGGRYVKSLILLCCCSMKMSLRAVWPGARALHEVLGPAAYAAGTSQKCSTLAYAPKEQASAPGPCSLLRESRLIPPGDDIFTEQQHAHPPRLDPVSPEDYTPRTFRGPGVPTVPKQEAVT